MAYYNTALFPGNLGIGKWDKAILNHFAKSVSTRWSRRYFFPTYLYYGGCIMKITKFLTLFIVILTMVCVQIQAQVPDNGAVFEEPNLPQCPQGYVLVADFGGFEASDLLRRDIEPKSRTHPFSLECPADLVAIGWTREGHPENPDCNLTGGTGSECTQSQNFENYTIALDGDVFGLYTDFVGLIENAYFPAGPWATTGGVGDHNMTFAHTLEGTGPQSVHYYIRLCADCVEPNFTVTKDCLSEPFPTDGQSVTFKIIITNTGDVALDFTTDEVNVGPFSLAPQEMFMKEISILVDPCETEVFNSIIVTAELPEAYQPADSIIKEANDTCVVQEGATRTQGFWQTHADYAAHVFDEHLGGYIDLGWTDINDTNELMAIFWAQNAFNSDGSRRNKLCQTTIICAQQALAAILNSGLDNGEPLPKTLQEIADTLGGTDVNAIQDLHYELAAYNEGGDGVAIIDNDGTLVAPADPKLAKQWAAAAPGTGDCEVEPPKPLKNQIQTLKGKGK